MGGLPGHITMLLAGLRAGDRSAVSQLMPLKLLLMRNCP